jgi:hypothetical protein
MARTGKPSQLAALEDIFEAQNQGGNALRLFTPAVVSTELANLILLHMMNEAAHADPKVAFPTVPKETFELRGGKMLVPNDKRLSKSHEVMTVTGKDLGELAADILLPKSFAIIEGTAGEFPVHCFRERHSGESGKHAKAWNTYLLASDYQLLELATAPSESYRQQVIAEMAHLEEGQSVGVGRGPEAWLPGFGEQGDKRTGDIDELQAIVSVNTRGELQITDTSGDRTTTVELPR